MLFLFLNFWLLLLKMYHVFVCDIFFLPSGHPINSVFQCQFLVIRCFDEAFFLLTIRIPMVTKLFRVVICGEELPPIISMTCQLSGLVESRDKWNTFLYLQKMYQHHNMEDADIVLEASNHDPLIKWPTWDHVAVWKIYRSRDKLKSLYVHYHIACGHRTW